MVQAFTPHYLEDELTLWMLKDIDYFALNPNSSSDEEKDAKSSSKSQKKETALWWKWTELEDILLTGLVLKQIYSRYSLKPTAAEIENAKNLGQNSSTIVWRIIHEDYMKAAKRYTLLHGKTIPSRTPGALQKRWKDCAKIAKSCETSNDAETPVMKWREIQWETSVNIDNVLTCDEETFNGLTSKKRKLN